MAKEIIELSNDECACSVSGDQSFKAW